jgi:curved DNA-binding protein CbpA
VGSAVTGQFQDHYKLLGIESKATPDIIQLAYNALFAVYDVNQGSQPNPEKLKEINLALEVLMDPVARKMFDAVRGGEDDREIVFSGMHFFENLPIERDRRMAMLCILYDVRCQNPRVPTLTLRQFEKLVQMSEEQVQLCLWYLKTLGLISVDDKSKMQITASGIDYVERNPPQPERILPILKNPNGPAKEGTGLANLSSALNNLAVPAPEPVSSEEAKPILLSFLKRTTAPAGES